MIKINSRAVPQIISGGLLKYQFKKGSARKKNAIPSGRLRL